MIQAWRTHFVVTRRDGSTVTVERFLDSFIDVNEVAGVIKARGVIVEPIDIVSVVPELPRTQMQQGENHD